MPDMKTVINLAFTGKAAYLIKGETVHSSLHMRMQNSYLNYETLSAYFNIWPTIYELIDLKFSHYVQLHLVFKIAATCT